MRYSLRLPQEKTEQVIAPDKAVKNKGGHFIQEMPEAIIVNN